MSEAKSNGMSFGTFSMIGIFGLLVVVFLVKLTDDPNATTPSETSSETVTSQASTEVTSSAPTQESSVFSFGGSTASEKLRKAESELKKLRDENAKLKAELSQQNKNLADNKQIIHHIDVLLQTDAAQDMQDAMTP